MRKSLPALSVVGAALSVFFLYAAPAQAQATRTWISGVGDDVNPCSRTAPCKTFAGAISKTAAGGEINCLDPAGFGALTITKSITIDCKSTHGGILQSSGQNGFIINFGSFAAADTRKSVRLRGLAFQGADCAQTTCTAGGLNGIRIIGTAAATNTEVFIEDTVIDGVTNRGVSDERDGGGKLFITNTTIRNVGTGDGIRVESVAGAPGTLHVVIENVRVQNANGNGLFLSNATRATVSRSVFTGNGGVGVLVQGTGQVNLYDMVSSHNGTGVLTNGGVGRLYGSDISFNTTGITGPTESSGNNRIAGNGVPGTTPTITVPAVQ